MPVYEFLCLSCKKKFTELCKIAERDSARNCHLCSSDNTKRLVSRCRTIRSEEELMEKLADPANMSGIDENDPKSMADWAKKMAREMGENMDDEIDSMAEEEFGAGGNDSTIPDMHD